VKGRRILQVVIPSLAWLLATSNAQAGLNVNFDEFGNGFVQNTTTGDLALLRVVQSPTSPTPGPLTYDLTGNRLVGLIANPGIYALNDNGADDIQDYVVFTNQGMIQFFSQNNDPTVDTSLADMQPFPVLNPAKNFGEGLFGNVMTTPMAGDPGFLPTPPGPVTYNFLSEGMVSIPEPSSWLLLGVGMLGVTAWRCRWGRPGPQG
jgi:hypothetical protein